jgi:hypothetical protein
VQVGFFTVEDGMLLNREKYVEIARRASVRSGLSFARHSEPVTIINTWRYVDLQLALRADISFAFALRAWTPDDLSATAALRTGPAYGEKALLKHDLAAAATNRTNCQTILRLGTRSIAAAASLHPGNLDFRRHASHDVLKTDLQVETDIFSALRAVSLPAAPAKEIEAKEIAQDVFESGENTGVEPAARSGALDALVAETIVHRAFLRVAQNAVCLCCFLELLLSVFVAGISIRVVLERKLSIGALQRGFVGVSLNAQDLVVISLGHGHGQGLTATLTIAGRSSLPLKL